MAYRCGEDDEPFLVPYGPLDKSNCEIRDSLEFARGIYNCISHLIATSCLMPGRPTTTDGPGTSGSRVALSFRQQQRNR